MAKVYVRAPKKSDFKTQQEYEEACLTNLEKALQRFKHKVQRESILVHYKMHAYYIPKSERRREAQKKGRRRAQKRERIKERYDNGL